MATKTLKVKVTKQCYIGHKRREIDQVFQVQTHLFSPNCMQILAGELSAEQLKKFKGQKFDEKSLKAIKPEPEAVEEIAGEEPVEPSAAAATASDADVI